MSDISLNIPLNRTRRPDLMRRFVGQVSRYLRNRRDMKTLAELPDYLLDDMGLTRAEIPGAVRGRKTPH